MKPEFQQENQALPNDQREEERFLLLAQIYKTQGVGHTLLCKTSHADVQAILRESSFYVRPIRLHC